MNVIFNLENRGSTIIFHFFALMIAGIIDIEEKTIINTGPDSDMRLIDKIDWNILSNDINNYDIVYPLLINYTGERLPFHSEVFEIIKDKVKLIENIDDYKTNDYKIINNYGSILTDYPFMPEKYIFYIRKLMLDRIITNPFNSSNNYYLSRKKACTCHNSPSYNISRRTILNEDELIENLKLFGFKTIYLEELSVVEKIQLFSSANIILSPFGGALTFTFFSNTKTKIIECLSNPKQNGYFEQFNHICSVLNINYTRFSNATTDENDNMTLNISELIKIIEVYITI